MSFGGAVKLTGESEYRSALRNITANLRELASEMKVVSSAYDKNDRSTEAVRAKTEALTRTLREQEQKLQTLKSAYAAFSASAGEQAAKHDALKARYEEEKQKLEEIGRTLGTTSDEYKQQQAAVQALAQEVQRSSRNQEANEQSMRRMRIEINNADADCRKTARAIEDLSQKEEDAGEEAQDAARDVQKLGDAARQSGNDAKEAGEGFTVFRGMVANLASNAISAAVDKIKELGQALVEIGRQSFSEWAANEQLAGGVETLFGDAADRVKENAARAFRTTGQSANAYMEQVTGFSATLLQGLKGDTRRAAEVADLAMRDMSDNANKMGTSMESIQYAYQGFAKDNYTMLDNLKLGYGGTQAEMARLINDSGVLGSAVEVTAKTVKDVPFDQIIAAIHQIQSEMGITGTTAEEAAHTIEGSAAAMKASWQNLLVSMAEGGEDLPEAVRQTVDAAIGYVNNAAPRIRQIVDSMKTMARSIVNDVFPQIKRKIPELKGVVEGFEWFVKNRGAVTGALKAMGAAFAAVKLAQWTKVLSEAGRGLAGIVSQTLASAAAKAAETGATVGLTTAQMALNAAWNANPVGVVIAGLTALVGVIALVKKGIDKATEAEREQRAAAKAAAEEYHNEAERRAADWEDTMKAQYNAIAAGDAETAKLRELSEELKLITDENGRVKKGYEDRASFIVSQLSEALGIEITKNGEVIQSYQKIQEEIDKTIEKKHAEMVLESQRATADEAKSKLPEAQNAVAEGKKQVEEARKVAREAEDAANDLYASSAEKYAAGNMIGAAIDWFKAKGNDKIAKERIENLRQYESALAENEQAVAQYAYQIGQYEQNMALFSEGAYDQMTEAGYEYVANAQSQAEAEAEVKRNELETLAEYIRVLKEKNEEAHSDALQSQIEAAEAQYSATQQSLQSLISTQMQKLQELNGNWDDSLGGILSTITGHDVQFQESGEGNVQMFVDGVATGEETSKEEMGVICQGILSVADGIDLFPAGQNATQGLANGLVSPAALAQLDANARFIANRVQSIMKSPAGFDINSPSKKMRRIGDSVTEGLSVGILTHKNELLENARGVSRDVIQNMRLHLSSPLGLADIALPDRESAAAAAEVSRRERGAERTGPNGAERLLGMIYNRLDSLDVNMNGRKVGAIVAGDVNRRLGGRETLEALGVV